MALTTFAGFCAKGSSFEEQPAQISSAITEIKIMGNETFISPSYDLNPANEQPNSASTPEICNSLNNFQFFSIKAQKRWLDNIKLPD